jgi:hypothetical protein
MRGERTGRRALTHAQVLEKVGGKSDIRSLVERVKKTEKRPDGSWVKKVRIVSCGFLIGKFRNG